MESIVIPKNQLITRILVMISVHEFVHYLTSLVEIFATMEF